MAQSLAQIYIHFIFHVRLVDVKREHLEELWNYIGGIARNQGSYVVAVGGEPDHVHMLCTLPRTITMADFAEEVKRGSSKWIKTKDDVYKKFSWQGGYACFSVSQSKIDDVESYIKNQYEHHKKQSFQDEYINWLQKYGVQYDPKYVLSE